MKDLLRTSDLTHDNFQRIIKLAEQFKVEPYQASCRLNNEAIVLYFNKPSTRTRISFQTAIARLGGTSIMVSPQELQLGRGETIEDTAKIISCYASIFVIRTFQDNDVQRLANTASIPVINALTDLHHPMQSLADMLTIQEKFGKLKGCKIAYVGDSNNVAHSLLEAATLAGIDMAIATPSTYQPQTEIIESAKILAKQSGSKIILTNDPYEAVTNADVVYTDTWISMGVPIEQQEKRLALLKPYQVNDQLMAQACSHAVFMHCLPAHRDKEVTASVIDGPQSIVFEQAENRLHTTIAVLFALVENLLN